jgi:protocatechuate 3,4-dioxygenase beta subunit
MTSLKRAPYIFLILATSVLFCLPKATPGQSSDSKPKGTASIAGKVTIAGKAAFGIVVAAFPDSYYRGALARTTTDSEGRYRLFGLAAATYQVTALAPAYITAGPSDNYPYGGKMILLSAAEAVEDVDIKLLRGAVITGRITDEEGKPVVEERVNLESVVDLAGRPIQMSPSYMNGQMYQTDDRGIYRIYGLPGGRYKVSVGNDNGGFLPNGARGHFAQTFYGDTNDAAKAAIIEVGEGSEASKIDIRLGRRGVTFSVAGHVVDSENGEPIAGVRPTYGRIAKANPGSGVFIGGMPTNPKGEFRFDGLEPGHYSLYVSSRFDGGDFYSEPIVFDVVDHNVTNLEIKALRGLSLSGVVVPEGDSGKDTLSKLSGLRIIAYMSSTSNPPTHNQGTGIIAPDGSFRISGVSPGKANLQIYSPENPNSRRFSLIRVERDGVDQTQGVDIQAGQSISNLRVLVSYGTGVIRGTVKFENGSPPPNTRTYVAIRREGLRFEMGTTTDARGHFIIKDVAPGSYEVILNLGFYAPSLQSPQRPQQPLKQFVTVADDTEVEVNFTVDLKPKEGGP